MAIHSTRPKGQFHAALCVARIAAMLIGATSVAVVVVKLAVPSYRYTVFTAFPAAWAGFRSFLAPQYLFLLVNLIILVIWNLSQKKAPDHSQHYRTEPASAKIADADVHEDAIIIPPSPRKLPYSHMDVGPSPDTNQKPSRDDNLPAPSSTALRPPSPDTNSNDSCVTAEDDSAEYHSPEAVASPLRHRRLAAIATPSRSAPASPYYPTGSAKTEPDAPESLEDAWRVITGTGAATPRLRKNETWRVPSRVVEMQPVPAASARREMKKSETFNDAAARRRPDTGRVEAPVSWERDELHQKFDAFIKKVNDQLRLQRQESERQRFVDRARRGY